jgi:hypothetical protein
MPSYVDSSGFAPIGAYLTVSRVLSFVFLIRFVLLIDPPGQLKSYTHMHATSIGNESECPGNDVGWTILVTLKNMKVGFDAD